MGTKKTEPGGMTPEHARAAVEAAEAAEFFQTPRWTVEALLRGGGPALPGGDWLDPCAGLGRIPLAVNAVRGDVRWRLCELRSACRPALLDVAHVDALAIGDFTDSRVQARLGDGGLANVVIFNSPFSLTVQFIEIAWALGRWVVSLQRANWIGPARAAWLRCHMPDRYTLPKRPSFRADGGTDGCEYEWHVWPPGGRDRRDGLTRMLELPGQLALFGGAR